MGQHISARGDPALAGEPLDLSPIRVGPEWTIEGAQRATPNQVTILTLMEGSCVSRLANFVGFDMDRLRQPEKRRQDADQNSGPVGFLKPRASLFKYRKQTHLTATLHRLTEFGHTTYGGESALAVAMTLARLLVYSRNTDLREFGPGQRFYLLRQPRKTCPIPRPHPLGRWPNSHAQAARMLE
jgi:hypothetical protein